MPCLSIRKILNYKFTFKNICLDINKYIFGIRGPCKILICKKGYLPQCVLAPSLTMFSITLTKMVKLRKKANHLNMFLEKTNICFAISRGVGRKFKKF